MSCVALCLVLLFYSSYCFLSYSAVSNCIVPGIVFCFVGLYCTVLCCFVLFGFVLCRAVLCCTSTLLCFTVPF